jgi:hypothetical protein
MKKLILAQLKDIQQKINNNRLTSGLVFGILILLIGGFFVFKSFGGNSQKVDLLPDIELNFEAEGPYGVISPRRDGNALLLDITRIGQYDAFSYQITYTDEKGIDRGAGSLDTWIELKNKSDYNQEILLGTCSQGYTSGNEHCVFDKGVENGTLVLRFRKGDQPYKMLTQWHLQKPDIALGNLVSGDNHFTYQIKAERADLTLIGFSVINDLTGAPKLPEGKQFLGKVYSLTTPTATDLKPGSISLEIAETPPADAKLARYSQKDNKWEELTTKVTGSKLTAEAAGSGIFAILVNQK